MPARSLSAAACPALQTQLSAPLRLRRDAEGSCPAWEGNGRNSVYVPQEPFSPKNPQPVHGIEAT